MVTIIILNFATAEVLVRTYDALSLTAEDVLDKLGLNEGDCQWMISENGFDFSIDLKQQVV